jgi:glutamate racemase
MTPTHDLPIGIFDSGVGGLTVLRAVRAQLPDEDLLYLGDTARVPYGNRGAETIRRYALNAAGLLADTGIKALVVACNTASAFALEALRDSLDVPVIGVIEPVARVAAEHTRTGVVAVLGTRGTVGSEVYPAAIRAHAPHAVMQQACPLFVPLAEEGWSNDPVTRAVADRYVATFAGTRVDTVILGCTHYPVLADTIAAAFHAAVAPNVRLLDSGSATAEALEKLLHEHGIRAPRGAGTVRFWATDAPESFAASATRIFGESVDAVEHVNIHDRSSS